MEGRLFSGVSTKDGYN